MREEAWFKWFIASFALHFFVMGVFFIPIKKSSKRIDLSSAYSVSLVGDLGGGAVGPPGPAGTETGKEIPAKKEPPKQAQVKKPPPAKTKPVPLRKEKDAVSLSKKKVPPVKEVKPTKHEKETATKDELKALADRLREIKKRTDYLDVTRRGMEGGSAKASGGAGAGMPGFPGAGEGGGKPLDLVTQKYYMEVWDKIKAAWGLPGASFKNLETIVTIKIRKDGRIVDINVEKRSGNRLYDESISRALRAVDPLPPIPSSLNTDTLEIGFRFLPGEMS